MLGCEATEEVLRQGDFDVVVLATGAHPLVPPIPGLPEGNVLLAADVLGGTQVVRGKHVLVLGGGLVGCETAEFLSMYGNAVEIVDMADALAADAVKRSRVVLLERLAREGVLSHLGITIKEVTPDGVLGERDGLPVQLDGFDCIVCALGFRAHNPLEEPVREFCDEVHVIGDATRARDAKYAIYEGYKLGLSL